MQFNRDVRSGVKQPEIEANGGLVYIRTNFVKTTKDDEVQWTYDEYIVSDNEYNDIQVGRYSGEWSDALRSTQRAYLYTAADAMIMKYSTDAEDEGKRKLWVDYKAAVRATQDQPGYPMEVTYPEFPE